MDPENVERLLRSLPRERASDFFTPRTIAQVRAGGGRRTDGWRRVAAAGCAIVVVAGVIGLLGRREARERERLTAVRAEQQSLERELHDIKQIAAETDPVVYLGSTDHYDYFIDLRQLEETSAVAQPAAYRPSQPGL